MTMSTSTGDACLPFAAAQPVHGVVAHHAQLRFSGCVTIRTPEEISVWFADGAVFFADDASEYSVADRLVADGILDAAQVRRATVQIDETRSLGFIAHRCTDVDVHRLLLWAELATASVLRASADQLAVSVESQRFVVHPEGLHLWQSDRQYVSVPPGTPSTNPVAGPALEPGSPQFFLAIDAAWEHAAAEDAACREPAHEPVESVDRRFALRSLIGGLRTRARS